MEWIQTLSIIATVLGAAYYIHRDIINDMKAQTARTDQLYGVWCETIKQLSDYRKESDQKFYDLLKEGRK